MNPTPSASGLQGFDPVYTKVSDFQFGEKIAFAGPVQNVIDLSVNANTPNRKIYAWLWAATTTTTTPFAVQGIITFYKGNSQAGTMPLSIGLGSAVTQSLPSVCTTNGTNVQDCLGVFLASATGTQPASIILQPLYIYGIFDRLTLSIQNTTGTTGATPLRAMLAVISSQ